MGVCFNNESGELPFLNRYVFFPGFFQIIKYNMYLCCREKCILSRQKYLVIMNESIEDKILAKSKKSKLPEVVVTGHRPQNVEEKEKKRGGTKHEK